MHRGRLGGRPCASRAGEEDPKVLVTTSREPSSRLTAFAKELKLIFPNAQRINRGGQARAPGPGCPPPPPARLQPATPTSPPVRVVARAHPLAYDRAASTGACLQVVGDLVDSCRSSGYTDIVIVHEHRGEPDGLVVCHLPFGAPLWRSSLPFHCGPHARPEPEPEPQLRAATAPRSVRRAPCRACSVQPRSLHGTRGRSAALHLL